MPRFHFKRSKIWEGAKHSEGALDESAPVVSVKTQKNDPDRARKLLPAAELGRHWIQVTPDGKRIGEM